METPYPPSEHWRFDHLSLVSTSPADPTPQALATLLGLHAGHRPPFPFPGRWFYSDDKALLHVVDTTPDRSPIPSPTVISHIAFRSDCTLKALLPRLEASGKPYRLLRLPEEQTVQIFVQMNAALLIELDIPIHPDDPTPADYQSEKDAPSHVQ